MRSIRSRFAVSATSDGRSGLQVLDLFSKIFFRFAQFSLKTSEQFVILSLGECEIVIR